jgi:hypothetical protein
MLEDCKMKKILISIAALCLAVSATRAETIDVSDNHGGHVPQYAARWAALAERDDVKVRIVGPCQSACTVLLGHISRNKICVTPSASFGFHLAHNPSSTSILRSAYQTDITGWINEHGGLTDRFIWMRAPDTYRFFKKC